MPATIDSPKTLDPVIRSALLDDEPTGAALVLLHTNSTLPFNHAMQRQNAQAIAAACREIAGLMPLPKLNKALELARERQARDGAEIVALIAELESRKAALAAEVARLAEQAERHTARRNFIEGVCVQCGGMMPDVLTATAELRAEAGC